MIAAPSFPRPVTRTITLGNSNLGVPAFFLDALTGNLSVASALNFEASPTTIPMTVVLR